MIRTTSSSSSSKEAHPLVTIVTVCFNAATHIEQTIKSVLAQSYSQIEYVVIDGGSTDGTLEIIERFSSRITKWISEPDDGIAHAMNKGLEMTRGDYVLFLHADDYLLSQTSIEEAVSYLQGDHEIVAFTIYYETSKGKVLNRPRGFDWRMNFKTGLWHQAVFCRRSLFDRIGGFDPSFKITMDYEFFLRAYKCGTLVKVVDFPVSVMRDVGISSRRDWDSLEKRLNEENKCHIKHCSSEIFRLFYSIYWYFYTPYKKMNITL